MQVKTAAPSRAQPNCIITYSTTQHPLVETSRGSLLSGIRSAVYEALKSQPRIANANSREQIDLTALAAAFARAANEDYSIGRRAMSGFSLCKGAVFVPLLEKDNDREWVRENHIGIENPIGGIYQEEFEIASYYNSNEPVRNVLAICAHVRGRRD